MGEMLIGSHFPVSHSRQGAMVKALPRQPSVTLNSFGAYPVQTDGRVPAHAGTQCHKRYASNPGLLLSQEHITCRSGIGGKQVQGDDPFLRPL
jgi:hypothetical protein